ncbi:MAG: shikimate kinase [Gemmatimonadetes bacterium]|nr:shikimate kinase [Gemmatimonadota bacterium]
MSHGGVPAPRRIVMVGFMAAGKSVVGRELARRLGWRLVDLDERIAERAGRSAGQLIREEGEAAFRALEREATAELAGAERVVLAPGGGWGTRPELTRLLGDGTVRVWLRISAAEAVTRAEAERVDRPLLGPRAGRLERSESLLRERSRFYQLAELVVEVEGRTPAELADEIVRRLDLDSGG